MTCIIGYKTGKSVYVAADSAATTEEGDIRHIVVEKIFRNGDYLIGYAGSIRAGQIFLPSRFEPPDSIEKLVEAMITKMGDLGCLVTTEYQTSASQTLFIIAYKNELYEILTDFQLNKISEGFTSIGCGASYAFGAMEVIQEEDLSPTEKLKKALAVTAKYNYAVKPPFVVKKY